MALKGLCGSFFSRKDGAALQGHVLELRGDWK